MEKKIIYKPWGSFEIIETTDSYQIKRLIVKPDQMLSLQYHHYRSEHWTVVKGIATCQVGEDIHLLSRNQTLYIPRGANHRLSNETDSDIELIEIQIGDYLGEDDIVRIEDMYSRE